MNVQTIRRNSTLTLAALAAPALPMSALTLPLVAFLPAYYAGPLKLNLSVIGIVFTIVRLIDIGFDPIIGAMIDRTVSRWGRFKPWLAGGVPVVLTGVVMLFFARTGVGPFYLATALLLTYAGYSVIVLAQLALSAEVSGNYTERLRTFAWWQGSTTLGLILVLMLPTLAGTGDTTRIVASMGLFVLITTPLSVVVTLFGVRDDSRPTMAPRARVSDYFGLFRRDTTRRVLLAELLLGLVGGITATCGIMFASASKLLTIQEYGVQIIVYFTTAIVSAPLWTWTARRIGKHYALAISGITYLVFLAAMWFTPVGNATLFLLASTIGGLSYTASSLLPRSMLADIGDEERLDTQVDRIGLLYALLTGIFKIGQAVSVGISFVLLDWVGYKVAEGPANAPSALLGLNIIYCGLPALCAIGASLLMIGYRLTAARHAEIRAALDSQEAEQRMF